MKYAICLVLLLPICAAAQAPTPAVPVKPWTGNFGGGFALTDGNSDTTNLNLTFLVTHDPKTRNVFKWNGLFLRGDKDDEDIIDRGATTLRDEYTITKRLFAYGQVGYLRDKFKDIMFLWAPNAGVGYKLVDRDTLVLSLDNGLGGVWERNHGRPTRGSGAYNAAERLTWKISNTATINESVSGLWKINEFSDALYIVTFGVTSSLTQHLELKFDFNELYKTRPVPTLKKSDLALITAVVVKF